LRAATGWGRGDYWFPDLGSAGGVALLFTLVLYPYVYLAARTAFLVQSQALIEASRILGHGPWRTFARIGVPLARPAVAAGVVLALLEALADFGTVQYYGVQTLTTAIYRTWYGLGNREGAAQIALVLIAIAGLLMLIERHSRGRARFHIAANLRHHADPVVLAPWPAAAAALACSLPVVLGFIVPTLHLAQLAWRSDALLVDRRFLGDTANSLGLAAVAAVIIVVLALFLSYAGRLVRRRALNRLIEFASLGYAIPGAVIAVGVLLPLASADHGIDRLSRSLFGMPSGLLLSGTAFALLLAYTVRFLAVGLANIAPGLAAIDPAMDASARMLGAKPREVLRRIHLPLLRGPVLTAAIVAFVEVMKELPATLLIRPFNLDTLAIGVYRFASDERLPQAAVGSIVIVVASLAPVIVLSRAIAGGRRPPSSG
jgi:iron(III) transport system permease protein